MLKYQIRKYENKFDVRWELWEYHKTLNRYFLWFIPIYDRKWKHIENFTTQVAAEKLLRELAEPHYTSIKDYDAKGQAIFYGF